MYDKFMINDLFWYRNIIFSDYIFLFEQELCSELSEVIKDKIKNNNNYYFK